jgi:hypothetical protein
MSSREEPRAAVPALLVSENFRKLPVLKNNRAVLSCIAIANCERCASAFSPHRAPRARSTKRTARETNPIEANAKPCFCAAGREKRIAERAPATKRTQGRLG